MSPGLAALAWLACAGPDTAAGGPSICMDPDGAFFDAPFPSDHRRVGDTLDLTGFPNPEEVDVVEDTLALLADARGWGTTSGVFFTAGAPLDPGSLPDLAGSVEAGAAAFLVDVDPASPERGLRVPIEVLYRDDPGPYGAPQLLSLLPLQGAPLRPGTRYAAAVTRGVLTAGGEPLSPSPALSALLRGEAPDGLDDGGVYLEAIDALEDLGEDPGALAGLAVFTTWDPLPPMAALVEAMAEHPLAPLGPLEVTDTFDDYCVLQTTVPIPVYQSGDPPYLTDGGAILFGDDGAPLLDHYEESRVVLTVPAGTPPAGGWPVAVMVRTGGGGDRPLVDRGTRGADGEPLVAGEGPARYFAAAGWAGLTWDGPHGGLRNVSGGDEQFLVFNVTNPAALRDNLRQSAAELTLLPELLPLLGEAEISDGDSDGASDGACGPVALNSGTLAVMGHSMGASIAPLALGVDPRWQAAVLSGAGGSWIENIVHKQSPLEVAPLAEAMLGLDAGDLSEHDPFLSLLQWAGEPADTPVFARGLLARDPAPHVLMFQGIVDTYILPPMANALSLSLGLDLGGEALDAASPELEEYDDLASLLPLSGGEQRALPLSANLDGGLTGAVVQHAEDGVEDGHEVMFQLDLPKRQYRCFLEELAAGEAPQIVAGGALGDPCR